MINIFYEEFEYINHYIKEIKENQKCIIYITVYEQHNHNPVAIVCSTIIKRFIIIIISEFNSFKYKVYLHLKMRIFYQHLQKPGGIIRVFF